MAQWTWHCSSNCTNPPASVLGVPVELGFEFDLAFPPFDAAFFALFASHWSSNLRLWDFASSFCHFRFALVLQFAPLGLRFDFFVHFIRHFQIDLTRLLYFFDLLVAFLALATIGY